MTLITRVLNGNLPLRLSTLKAARQVCIIIGIL